MSTPYEEGEIATTVDLIRESLAQEFPRLAPLRGIPVRSPAFERALPELLAHSQKTRLLELRTEVGRLKEITERLVAVTNQGTQSAEQLYGLSKRLLIAALATLGVSLGTLAAAILQVAR